MLLPCYVTLSALFATKPELHQQSKIVTVGNKVRGGGNVSLSCEQNPLTLIKGSPLPITQHSELLSAAYTLTMQLFLSC